MSTPKLRADPPARLLWRSLVAGAAVICLRSQHRHVFGADGRL